MKKIIMLMSAVGLVAGVAANVAHASDGSILFQGAVIASTCKVGNAGTGNELTVMLPDVGTGALTAAGMTAGRTPFSLQLTGCGTSDDAPTKVAVSWESGTTVNLATGRLKPSMADAATNVELGLLNDKYEPIKIGAAGVDAQQSQTVSIADGGANMQYAVEYVATGAATAGDASSYVAYSLVYP
ncbi:fimbrial protein [Burkholderia sp. AW33-5]